jgi:enamine deaminase RidA (YjgF/YER057c/UK114 family)
LALLNPVPTSAKPNGRPLTSTSNDEPSAGRCLKLGGFVSCAPDFTDHPEVVNGASDLIVLAMGEAGHHARFAVGCPSLPRNAAVEVEAIFELA